MLGLRDRLPARPTNPPANRERVVCFECQWAGLDTGSVLGSPDEELASNREPVPFGGPREVLKAGLH